MITTEEEVHLAAMIKEGKQSAIDSLAKANLWFVVSVAKRYERQNLYF